MNLIYTASFKDLTHIPVPEDREDFFRIYWLQEQGELPLLKEQESLIKGEWMYLVPPFREFRIDRMDKEGRFVAFHRSLLDLEVREYSLDVFRLFSSKGEFTTLMIGEEELPTLDTLYELLRRELPKPDNFLFLKSLLKTFLLKLIFLKEKKYTLPDLNEKRIHEFLYLLENHFLTERKAGFYADKLNLSPKRLNQILKEKLGKTITQLLHERLIMEARHELYVSNKSIMEIGIHLGFSDKSYFSRFFRKITGMSPENYKRGLRQHFEERQ